MISGDAFARKMKWRKWYCVTPFVVPAADMLGAPKGLRVNIFVFWTKSSSLNPSVIGVLGPPPCTPFANTWSPPIRVVLISMKPSFSSTVIWETKSFTRTSTGKRQSSYLSSLLFLFKSLNDNFPTRRVGVFIATITGCVCASSELEAKSKAISTRDFIGFFFLCIGKQINSHF